MRRKIWLMLPLLAFVLVTTPSCSKKTGCAMNENVGAKTDKKGNLSTKGGKSQLFPKKMRRK